MFEFGAKPGIEARKLARRYGACAVAWLDEESRRILDAHLAAGRLPWGFLRAFGLSKYAVRYHRRHSCCRFPHHSEKQREWSARFIQFQNRWKPGQSGGGNRKGHPDKRPRRKPSGIKAAIIAERQERAERLEKAKQAAILEAESRRERMNPPHSPFF